MIVSDKVIVENFLTDFYAVVHHPRLLIRIIHVNGHRKKKATLLIVIVEGLRAP